MRGEKTGVNDGRFFFLYVELKHQNCLSKKRERKCLNAEIREELRELRERAKGAQ